MIVSELSQRPDVQLGPDLFSAFLTPTRNLTSLYGDRLHFNGLGYAYYAHLWYNAINPSDPVALPYILDKLEPSTRSPYLQQNLLEVGDQYYVDESFTLSQIPSLLDGGVWIMTANADRLRTSSSYLSFDTDRPVTVYVAYDAGAGAIPSWLRSGNGFTDTGAQVKVNGDPRTSTLRVYRKNYPAGTVSDLAGNLAAGASGANSNYLVIVKP